MCQLLYAASDTPNASVRMVDTATMNRLNDMQHVWYFILELISVHFRRRPLFDQTIRHRQAGRQEGQMTSMWQQECQKMLRLAEDTMTLSLDQQRSPMNNNMSVIITNNVQLLRYNYTRLERELSKAEQSGGSAADDVLAKWEKMLIRLVKQIELLESRVIACDSKPNAAPAILGPLIYTMDDDENEDKFQDPLTSAATKNMNEVQLLQMQDSILAQQDSALDSLSLVVGRHKEMGLMISDELELQADLLDRVEHGVDNTQMRLSGARRRLDEIGKKASGHWCSICTVILVLIIILILAIKI